MGKKLAVVEKSITCFKQIWNKYSYAFFQFVTKVLSCCWI